MKKNEKYYQHVVGNWDFLVTFKLISLKGLLSSSIHWTHKIRAVGMLLNQMFFGQFSMQTRVELDLASHRAKHFLHLSKWGFVFYRSEKRLVLDSNGSDLQFDGEEYFWPIMKNPEPFRNFRGHVEEDFTSASYQWPLFNSPFPCKTLFGKNQGVIQLDTGWLQCEFKLTDKSLAELNQR